MLCHLFLSSHPFSSNHLYTLLLWLFDFRWVGVGNFFSFIVPDTPWIFSNWRQLLFNFRNIVFPCYFLYIPSKIPSSLILHLKDLSSKLLRFSTLYHYIHCYIFCKIFLILSFGTPIVDFSFSHIFFFLWGFLIVLSGDAFSQHPIDSWVPCFLLYDGNIQIIIMWSFFSSFSSFFTLSLFLLCFSFLCNYSVSLSS